MIDTNSVVAAVRSIFEETLCCFDESDTVLVENDFRDMRIAYTSGRLLCGARDVTCVECRIYTDTKQMWIGALRVTRALRSRGPGRQLVVAAEEIASLLGVQTVSAFASVSAQGFWEKMGYAPHSKTARVVTKDLDEDSVATPDSRASVPTLLRDPRFFDYRDSTETKSSY